MKYIICAHTKWKHYLNNYCHLGKWETLTNSKSSKSPRPKYERRVAYVDASTRVQRTYINFVKTSQNVWS